jgi:N-acetylglucosaminyl-diphospho-decaprenol L-rhamnosyltransferase
MTPALDVVIVSYRCRELLRVCLDSLLGEGHPSGGLAVTVVDNASGDGTAELVGGTYPDVRLVASPQNLGFATATNLGIRLGTAPYALALNPDTRIPAGTLDALLALMEDRPEIGIAGCRLERPDGSLDHAATRSFPTPLSALSHFTKTGRGYAADPAVSGPSDAVNGAFMLLRRRALEEVGLFDEGYWMYMEDLDLCYRFAEAGWTTWYEASVAALHHKGGTSGPLRSPRLTYHFHYGMLRFYRAHYAPQSSKLLNGVIYAGIATKLAVTVVRTELRRLLRR